MKSLKSVMKSWLLCELSMKMISFQIIKTIKTIKINKYKNMNLNNDNGYHKYLTNKINCEI